jgi:hypothetical protein
MKRFLMLTAVAAVAGVMYVAAATGSRQATPPTAKQFAALKKRVVGLSKSLKALKTDEGKVKTLAVAEAQLLVACASQTVPIDQFGDATGQTQGYHYSQTPPATSTASDTFATALDAAATTDTTAVWFVGGDSSCGTAMTGGALRHDAAAAGLSLPHVAVHHAFTAHRP